MKKVYYNWSQIQGACLELARQIQESHWQPDYIVGLVRGGLAPAVLLSQYTDIPMHALQICLRDHTETESNLWMAEDAWNHKNILIVDDINDSGATIAALKADWMSGCYPGNEAWDTIWYETVRFAVLTNNMSSKETTNYSVWEVNKAENDCWIVHPWEEFWLPKVDF